MKRRVWDNDATVYMLLHHETLRTHLESNPDVLERALDKRTKVLRLARIGL